MTCSGSSMAKLRNIGIRLKRSPRVINGRTPTANSRLAFEAKPDSITRSNLRDLRDLPHKENSIRSCLSGGMLALRGPTPVDGGIIALTCISSNHQGQSTQPEYLWRNISFIQTGAKSRR